MKKISIIILNWNGKTDTLACLGSLKKLRTPNSELQTIVVDNGSTDGSVEKLKEFIEDYSRQFAGGIENSLGRKEARMPHIRENSCKPPIKLIENRTNLGFAEGNNVGIRYAVGNGADYVILLNNDTVVKDNLVDELVKVAESDPKIGVVSPKIYFAPGFEFHKDRYKKRELGKVIWYAGGKIDWQNVLGSHRGVDEVDKGQYDKVEETDFATGCCMLIKKEVFEKINLLDKKYFLYLEDLDFCQRARMAGYKIVYAPQGILWHKNASSSDKPGSQLHIYYQTRNRLLFGFRYASLRIKFALFRESLKFLIEGGIKRKAVSDFYVGRFGKGRLE